MCADTFTLRIMLMKQDKVLSEFNSLPREAQQEVLDFITFLRSRYSPSRKDETESKSSLAEENFVGIWRNRTDLEDSTKWVREIRTNEWD